MSTAMDTAQQIVSWCTAHSRTAAAAESCTGGLIAHQITNVPGASVIFQGGVVVYANSAKTALLQVSEQEIAAHGAVSEMVALAMAQGARHALAADYAVATTGIAGPGGGTPTKPVGTVFIAAAGPDVTRVRKHQFSGDRLAIKEQSCAAALSLLLEVMELS